MSKEGDPKPAEKIGTFSQETRDLAASDKTLEEIFAEQTKKANQVREKEPKTTEEIGQEVTKIKEESGLSNEPSEKDIIEGRVYRGEGGKLLTYQETLSHIEEGYKKSMSEIELLMKKYGIEVSDLYLRKDTGSDQLMEALKETLKNIRDLRETAILGRENMISKVKQFERSRLNEMTKKEVSVDPSEEIEIVTKEISEADNLDELCKILEQKKEVIEKDGTKKNSGEYIRFIRSMEKNFSELPRSAGRKILQNIRNNPFTTSPDLQQKAYKLFKELIESKPEK